MKKFVWNSSVEEKDKHNDIMNTPTHASDDNKRCPSDMSVTNQYDSNDMKKSISLMCPSVDGNDRRSILSDE
jgi:hypothetical protein